MKDEKRIDKMENKIDNLISRFEEIRIDNQKNNTELRLDLAKIETMFKVIAEQYKTFNDKILEVEKDSVNSIKELKIKLESLENKLEEINNWKQNFTGKIAVIVSLLFIAIEVLLKVFL